jgi:hypothetical protein
MDGGAVRLPQLGAVKAFCVKKGGETTLLISNSMTFRTNKFVSVALNEQDARKNSKQKKYERNKVGIETFPEPQVHISAEPTEPAFSECIVFSHAPLFNAKNTTKLYGIRD